MGLSHFLLQIWKCFSIFLSLLFSLTRSLPTICLPFPCLSNQERSKIPLRLFRAERRRKPVPTPHFLCPNTCVWDLGYRIICAITLLMLLTDIFKFMYVGMAFLAIKFMCFQSFYIGQGLKWKNSL